MAGHRDRVDRVVLMACDAYDAFHPAALGDGCALRWRGMLEVWSRDEVSLSVATRLPA